MTNKRSVTFRALATFVSGIFFFTNVALATTTESSLWAQRRRHIRNDQRGMENLVLASLRGSVSPGQLFQTLPLTPSASALSGDLAKTLPAPFVAEHAPLFSALHSSHGTIRKIWWPERGAGKRVVVHVQDVHQNEDAQRHIGATVDSLLQAHQVGLVALEGAFAPIDVKPFHDFDDREVIGLTADCLLRENLITGPVHAFMTAKAMLPLLVGVDDLAHYNANVEAYRQSAPRIEAYKNDLSRQKAGLEQEKKVVFSPALAAFDAAVIAYKEERLSLTDFVGVLSPTPGVGQAGLLVQALSLEKDLDFGKVEADRKAMIDVLVKSLNKAHVDQLIQESAQYRMGAVRTGDFYCYLQTLCRSAKIELAQFPNMDAYIRYVLLSDRIDGEKLMEEMASLQKERYAQLAKTRDEKDLVAKSYALLLSGRLLSFSLTPSEWEDYEGLKNMRKKDGLGGMDLASFESFYKEAHARDETIARNLLLQMDQGNIDTAVLVTGGYHSPGVSERLRQAGVTVVSFTPRIDKVDTARGSAYLSVFTQEKTPLEKLFEGEKLFVTQNPVSEPAKEMGAIIGAGAEVLKKSDSGVALTVFRRLGGNVKARMKVALKSPLVARIRIWMGDRKPAVDIEVKKLPEKLSFSQKDVLPFGVLAMFLNQSTWAADAVGNAGFDPAYNVLIFFASAIGTWVASRFFRSSGIRWTLRFVGIVAGLGMGGVPFDLLLTITLLMGPIVASFVVVGSNLDKKEARKEKINSEQSENSRSESSASGGNKISLSFSSIFLLGRSLLGTCLLGYPIQAEAALRISDIVAPSSILGFLTLIALVAFSGWIWLYRLEKAHPPLLLPVPNSVNKPSNLNFLNFRWVKPTILFFEIGLLSSLALARDAGQLFDVTGIFLLVLFVVPVFLEKMLSREGASEAVVISGESEPVKTLTPSEAENLPAIELVDRKLKESFYQFAINNKLDFRNAKFGPVRNRPGTNRYTMAIVVGNSRFIGHAIEVKTNQNSAENESTALFWTKIVPVPGEKLVPLESKSVIKIKNPITPPEREAWKAFKEYAEKNNLDFKKARFYPARKDGGDRYLVAIKIGGQSYMAEVEGTSKTGFAVLVSVPPANIKVMKAGKEVLIEEKIGSMAPIKSHLRTAFNDYAAIKKLDLSGAIFTFFESVAQKQPSLAVNIGGNRFVVEGLQYGVVKNKEVRRVTELSVLNPREVVYENRLGGRVRTATDEWSAMRPILQPNNILFLKTGKWARGGFVLDAVFLLGMAAAGASLTWLFPLFAFLHVCLEVQNNPKMPPQERVISFLSHLIFALPYGIPDFSNGVFHILPLINSAIAVGLHGAYDEYTIGLDDGRKMGLLKTGTAAQKMDVLMGGPGRVTEALAGGIVSETPEFLQRVSASHQGYFYSLGIQHGMAKTAGEKADIPIVEKPVGTAEQLKEMVSLASGMLNYNEANPSKRSFLTVTPSGNMTPEQISAALSNAGIRGHMVYVKKVTGPLSFDVFGNEFEQALKHFRVRPENMFLILAGKPEIGDIGQFAEGGPTLDALRQALLKALLGNMPEIAPHVILFMLNAGSLADKSA